MKRVSVVALGGVIVVAVAGALLLISDDDARHTRASVRANERQRAAEESQSSAPSEAGDLAALRKLQHLLSTTGVLATTNRVPITSVDALARSAASVVEGTIVAVEPAEPVPWALTASGQNDLDRGTVSTGVVFEIAVAERVTRDG